MASSPSLSVTARSLRRILSREQKVKLALSAVGSIVLGLLDSLAIAIVLPLVDVATGTGANSTPIHIVEDLLGTHNLDSLRVPLSIVLVALFVVKDVGSMCFTWWSATFINTQRVLLSARILERYLTSPYTEMSRRSSAELMRTMDASVLQVFTYTITGLINLTASIFAVATVLVMLFLLAPVPTGALVVYFFIAAWLYLRLVRKRASRAGERLNESSRQGWRTAFAALGGMKEVNLRGSHRHFVDGFRDAQLEGAYAGRSAMVLNILPSYVLEICFISAVGIVMALSSNPTHGNSSALASIALFVAAGFRVLPSITSILSSISSIRIGGDSVEVVAKELDALGVTQESNALQARRSARDAAVHLSRYRRAGPAGRIADHPARPVTRGRGPERRRQDDARGHHSRTPRAAGGPDRDRRLRCHLTSTVVAGAPWLRPSGRLHSRRDARRERRLRRAETRDRPGTVGDGPPEGPARRGGRPPAGWRRHVARRARRAPLRWSAPASGDRPGALPPATAPGARRGDVRPG